MRKIKGGGESSLATVANSFHFIYSHIHYYLDHRSGLASELSLLIKESKILELSNLCYIRNSKGIYILRSTSTSVTVTAPTLCTTSPVLLHATENFGIKHTVPIYIA